MKIISNYNGLSIPVPANIPNRAKEILIHAVTCYSFLMFGRKEFTFSELADEIEKAYSMDEPRNKVMVFALRMV